MSADQLWVRVLDELEAHLVAAEELANGLRPAPFVAWRPPTPGEPIPAHLVPRAEVLLARQRQVTERIPELISETAAHLRTTHRVSRMQGRPERPAVFVDVSA